MSHYPAHLLIGVAAMALTLAIQAVTANRMIRRKLRVSVALVGAHLLLNVVLAVVSPE
jgi:hypothetical protein